jgi:hypothetical protein
MLKRKRVKFNGNQQFILEDAMALQKQLDETEEGIVTLMSLPPGVLTGRLTFLVGRTDDELSVRAGTTTEPCFLSVLRNDLGSSSTNNFKTIIPFSTFAEDDTQRAGEVEPFYFDMGDKLTALTQLYNNNGNDLTSLPDAYIVAKVTYQDGDNEARKVYDGIQNAAFVQNVDTRNIGEISLRLEINGIDNFNPSLSLKQNECIIGTVYNNSEDPYGRTRIGYYLTSIVPPRLAVLPQNVVTNHAAQKFMQKLFLKADDIFDTSYLNDSSFFQAVNFLQTQYIHKMINNGTDDPPDFLASEGATSHNRMFANFTRYPRNSLDGLRYRIDNFADVGVLDQADTEQTYEAADPRERDPRLIAQAPVLFLEYATQGLLAPPIGQNDAFYPPGRWDAANGYWRNGIGYPVNAGAITSPYYMAGFGTDLTGDGVTEFNYITTPRFPVYPHIDLMLRPGFCDDYYVQHVEVECYPYGTSYLGGDAWDPMMNPKQFFHVDTGNREDQKYVRFCSLADYINILPQAEFDRAEVVTISNGIDPSSGSAQALMAGQPNEMYHIEMSNNNGDPNVNSYSQFWPTPVRDSIRIFSPLFVPGIKKDQIEAFFDGSQAVRATFMRNLNLDTDGSDHPTYSNWPTSPTTFSGTGALPVDFVLMVRVYGNKKDS